MGSSFTAKKGKDALFEYVSGQTYKPKSYVEKDFRIYKSNTQTATGFTETEWDNVGDAGNLTLKEVVTNGNISDRNISMENDGSTTELMLNINAKGISQSSTILLSRNTSDNGGGLTFTDNSVNPDLNQITFFKKTAGVKSSVMSFTTTTVTPLVTVYGDFTNTNSFYSCGTMCGHTNLNINGSISEGGVELTNRYLRTDQDGYSKSNIFTDGNITVNHSGGTGTYGCVEIKGDTSNLLFGYGNNECTAGMTFDPVINGALSINSTLFATTYTPIEIPFASNNVNFGECVNITSCSFALQHIDTSDKRLKINPEPIENPLEITMGLCGLKHNRVDVKNENEIHISLIADDVEKILPEVVVTNPWEKKLDNGETISNIKGIKYNSLIPILIESIKELNAEIIQIKAQLNK